jgi:hypothetical protein
MNPLYRLCAALFVARLVGGIDVDGAHMRRGNEQIGRAMAANRPHTPVATPGFSPNVVTVPLWGHCE